MYEFAQDEIDSLSFSLFRGWRLGHPTHAIVRRECLFLLTACVRRVCLIITECFSCMDLLRACCLRVTVACIYGIVCWVCLLHLSPACSCLDVFGLHLIAARNYLIFVTRYCHVSLLQYCTHQLYLLDLDAEFQPKDTASGLSLRIFFLFVADRIVFMICCEHVC